ncbi:MAG TPA: hypothetical protein VGM23_01970 [Armatimonadota bacterium]|jgi:hypothetical protein
MEEVEAYPRQDFVGYGLWVLAILLLVAVFGLTLVLSLQGF